jgi:hypothetical protein
MKCARYVAAYWMGLCEGERKKVPEIENLFMTRARKSWNDDVI